MVKQNDFGMIGCPAKLPWNGFLPIKNASGMKTHVAKQLFNNNLSATIAGDQNVGQAQPFWNDWLSGKTPLECFLPDKNASGMKSHAAKHLFNHDSSVTTAGNQNFGQPEPLWNDWSSGKTPLECFSTSQKRLWNESSYGKTSLQE